MRNLLAPLVTASAVVTVVFHSLVSVARLAVPSAAAVAPDALVAVEKYPAFTYFLWRELVQIC